MADRRKNNGGHSTKGKAGRKPKVEEERVLQLSKQAIIDSFGSESKLWKSIADKAPDDFRYMKLLIEYRFGKPKETVENKINVASIDPIEWVK